LHLPITPQLDEQRLPLLRTFVSRRGQALRGTLQPDDGRRSRRGDNCSRTARSKKDRSKTTMARNGANPGDVPMARSLRSSHTRRGRSRAQEIGRIARGSGSSSLLRQRQPCRHG
jgi:hypothetical protein